MIEFFLSPSNTPFVVALALMVTFTIIEILSASLGMGLSELVDSLLPEFDADIDIDIDVDADVDVPDVSGPTDSLTKLLAWFRVGEVPVIMLFIVFLTGFGLSGLTVQFILVAVIGKALPSSIAALAAFFAALPMVRFLGGLLGKYMPKDETYVVSEESFVGMLASITLGDATVDKPAQAKLHDKHGQAHYFLVEPDNPEDHFEQGEKVIIVSKHGTIFKVIAADNAAMTD